MLEHKECSRSISIAVENPTTVLYMMRGGCGEGHNVVNRHKNPGRQQKRVCATGWRNRHRIVVLDAVYRKMIL